MDNLGQHNVELSTLSKLTIAQYTDTFCEQSRQFVVISGSAFALDENKVPIRKEPIDESIQELVPTSLRALLLQQAHQSTLADRHGEPSMYDSLRQDYYQQHTVADVYNIVKNCVLSTLMGTRFKHPRHLKRFPPAGRLKLATIDIIGILPRTKTENIIVVLMTD